MSELLETFRRRRSGRSLREERTQLTIASIAAVAVIVAAVVSLPGSDEASETTSAAENPAATGDDTRAPGSAIDTAVAGADDVSARIAETSNSGSGASAPAEAAAPTRGLAPITDKDIKVGMAYVEDPGTANAAAGFGGIGQVDQKRAWDLVVREINKKAPFGRRIVPVFYSYTTDEAQSKGAERLYQEMCAKWTQDDRVFMAFTGAASDDTLPSCLTKARVPQVGGGTGFSYAETFKKFPYLVEHNSAAMDRMASFQIDQLVKERFFKEFKENAPPYTPQRPPDGKPRIGLIRYDTPSHVAGAASMKRRLAAHKLALCDGCEFSIAYSSDNVQEQLDDATEVNAAIQSCKAKNCTHMLFLGSTAGVRITLFFVDGAEKQSYRPRLGLNTMDAPAAVRDFLGAASYPQFRDSILVTSRPGDFDEERPAFKRCKKLFEDAGETFSGDEAANKEAQIPVYCDTAWYVSAALQKAGRSLDVSSWMDAVESIAEVEAASTFRMRTTPIRHDGASAVRRARWSDDCACFEPTTGEVPV